MLPVHIKSGASSLRASGTVIPYGNNKVCMSLEIPMPDRSIYSLDVTFIFKEDPGRDTGFGLVNAFENMNPEDIGRAARFDLTIYNCSRPGGVVNEKPVALGEFSGSTLYLNFMAEGREQSGHKILHYSFYTT